MDEAHKTNCTDCAAVCCRMEVMLISDTGVPDRYVSIEHRGAHTLRRLDDGWCAALNRNTMLCTIYESRPLICRDFELNGPDCIAARKEPFGR